MINKQEIKERKQRIEKMINSTTYFHVKEFWRGYIQTLDNLLEGQFDKEGSNDNK